MNRTPVAIVLLVATLAFWVYSCSSGNASSAAIESPVVEVASKDTSVEPGVCRSYAEPVEWGKVVFDKLKEASGLAASRKNPGVLWAHNDSGDDAVVYAFSNVGAYLGSITLVGVNAVDWEDMAIGPCGTESCLYIADIGDNIQKRSDYTVYRVEEPDVDSKVPFGELYLAKWQKYPFTYPDSSYNAESLVVTPDERLAVFTKQVGVSRMYVFPHLAHDVPVKLIYVGDLVLDVPMAYATGADLNQAGSRLLVRTYNSILEWSLVPGKGFFEIHGKQGRSVPSAPEKQGEAVAFDPVSGGYLQIGEGRHPVIYRIGCPK